MSTHYSGFDLIVLPTDSQYIRKLLKLNGLSQSLVLTVM